MVIPFPEKLKNLARLFPVPLYCVGGYVRNYLLCGKPSADIDLAAPLLSADASRYILLSGFKIVAEYPKTGTVVFSDGKQKYEYTSFRKDEYSGGGHSPENTTFTGDIISDALRRDFKCNAVYYNINSGSFTDPLGGINDIERKILDTTGSPETVFSHDGLRLMRLARFTGELNFTPTKKVLAGAKKFADNICDVAEERVFDELKKILVADKKYTFSNPCGHYAALKILDETRVLDEILPELTAGRNLEQRKDFHNYDVLEHSLKAVLYADEKVRLAALIHDVGKPACYKETGRFFNHDKRGETIARKIAARLKFDKKTTYQTVFLTRCHMVDLDLNMRESKVRLFIVENLKYFSDLMLLKQADFSAGKDDISIAPSVAKWQKIYEKMKDEGAPFCIKDLDVSAADLMSSGVKQERLAEVFKMLLKKAVTGEIKNRKAALISAAAKI